jgi:hypothetical protein
MKFSVYVQYGYYELMSFIEDCIQNNNNNNYNKYQKKLTDDEMNEEINELYERNIEENPTKYLGLDYGEEWEQV